MCIRVKRDIKKEFKETKKSLKEGRIKIGDGDAFKSSFHSTDSLLGKVRE